MNRKTKAKWLWLFVIPLFPIFIHPWWLFVLSAVVFCFLVWLLEVKKENSN
jgi:hypothetical protein